MVSGDYIEFKNESIGDIAAITNTQQGQWDEIWNGVRTRLSGLVSDALDALTGSSLDDRSAQYHQKSQQYSSDMNLQHVAMNNIRSISEETNNNMARVIAG
jgi:hypothetical protein